MSIGGGSGRDRTSRRVETLSAVAGGCEGGNSTHWRWRGGVSRLEGSSQKTMPDNYSDAATTNDAYFSQLTYNRRSLNDICKYSATPPLVNRIFMSEGSFAIRRPFLSIEAYFVPYGSVNNLTLGDASQEIVEED